MLFWLVSFARLHAVETPLLSDLFSDKERYYQNVPESSCWYYLGGIYSFAHLNTDPSQGNSGQLRMISTGGDSSTAMALAYFTAAGSPQNLAAGESLTLEFKVRLDRLIDADSNLRFALFNSKGTRPTGDVQGYGYDNLYNNNHDGYQVALNTGAPAGALRIYERNNQGGGSPFSLNASAIRGTNSAAALNLPVKKFFPVKLVIARSSGAGSSITLTATVNGVTVTGTDGSSLLTSFDGLGVYVTNQALGLNQELRLDDVTVTHSATANPLLSDSFTDGERVTQSLPNSAKWFYNGADSSGNLCTAAVTVPGTELAFTPGGVDAMTVTYFTNRNSPKALAVGESLTLQASLRLDLLQNAPDGLRFGVFNSQGSRTADDVETGVASTSIFNGYRGYDLSLNPAGGGFNISRRQSNGPNLFDPATRARLGADNSSSLDLSLDPEKISRLSLTLTRIDASTIRLEGTLNGHSVIRTDTSAITTSFDTFALYASTAAFPYDGPQIFIDRVSISHTSAPAAVPSQGKILAESFNGSGWASATFAGVQASGSVNAGAYGTIDILGSVTPSPGLQLAVNSASSVGAWSGELRSGLLPVSNSETALGKLSLAFDLLASSAYPVRVRVESANASGVVSGTLERTIFPAAPNAFQRYAMELSDFTTVSGTFDPTAPNVRFSFVVQGGTGSAEDWPVSAAHALQIDNLYYARPAYYVKPGGNDSLSGRTEANAFGTIAKALQVAGTGDIILLMEGTSSPAYTLNGGIYFSRGGSSAGWVTLKNYPGQNPIVYLPVLDSSPYYTLAVASGYPGYTSNGTQYPGYYDTTINLNYIEVRGFRLQGAADQLPEADRGQATAKSNVSGISIDGRYIAVAPHHIRVADMEVSNFPGGGIGGGDCDWIYFENNSIHDTSNWTIYASSGMSVLTPFNFDGTSGTHRIFLLGNRIYRNETMEPWVAIGAISDGNGAILDTFVSVERGIYLGRAIVANNLLYQNGGSGIHGLKVNGADIVHNTVYRNSHSPALQYASVFAYASNDIIVANNIIEASANKPINDSTYANNFPRTTGIRFLNNLYFSEGTATPYSEVQDAGNITASVAGQVGFVDGPNGDFRLRTGSRAFNGGTASLSTVLPRDFYGMPRRTDGAPDIGAIDRLPILLTAPTGTTINQHGSASFAAAATGAGPNSSLAYQWQKNGVDLPGETAAQINLTDASPAQAGAYRVRIAHLVNGTEVDAIFSPIATLSINGVDSVTNFIALTNPSFESSVGYLGGATSNVPGWTASNGGAYGNVAVNTGSSLFYSGVSGNNVIFLGGGLTQTTGATYVKDVTYILTVDAGQPSGASGMTGFLFGFRTDDTSVNNGFKPFGNGSAFSGDYSTPGLMQTYSLAYTATAADAGQPIKIGFYDYFANDQRYRLDNVTLSSNSTFTKQQTWRKTYFGQTDNTGSAADLADPDGDGVVNFLEYALNSDPRQSSSTRLPAVGVNAGGQLTLSFLRSRTELNYVVQGTSDLAVPWTDLVINPGTVSVTTPVIFTDPVTNSARRFLRLKVTAP